MNYAKYLERHRREARNYYARNREAILERRREARRVAREAYTAELTAFEDANIAMEHNADCDRPWCSYDCGCIPCRLGTALPLDPESPDYRQWRSEVEASGGKCNPRYA